MYRIASGSLYGYGGVMKFLFICLALFAAAVSADVYRSVNEAGEVVFSDVPSKGSERVNLPPLSTIKPPKPAASSVSTGSKPGAAEPIYRSFQVATPENDATIWDNQGDIKLGVLLEPSLQIAQGHKIQYFLDGAAYGLAEQSLTNQYRNLDRGTHTLSASVVDGKGKAVISTNPVTVHLHKASSLHPNSPLNPAGSSGASN